MNEYLQHYIDGRWVDSEGGRRHEVINPATEKPVSAITLGSQADVDKAVAAARRAFASFSRTSREERLALVQRIIEQYKARSADIARAISEEMGAPMTLATTAQSGAGIGHFIAIARVLEDFPLVENAGRNRVVYEPVGVVALITPWNWPLNQIAAKVAPALAAGNTIVLKPSEQTPGSAAIFTEVLDAAGVPPGVFNLVQGDGPGVGEALAKHADVDMVSFTGSTRAGIAVAKNAADTVKRVHQELGGKSPNILLPGADLDKALPRAAGGVLNNSGQSCIAPTRLLVHRDQYGEAGERLAKLFDEARVDDPQKEGDHIGPVVNRPQFDKIQRLIEKGIEEGARLVAGGPGRPGDKPTGFYVRPTLFADVSNSMTIAREEIFGPVLAVIPYDSLDQAVEIANDTPYGLAAYVSGDPAVAREIVPRLRAGSVWVNSMGVDIFTPFGGYKQSGNGREFGRYGLEEFMEKKSVIGDLGEPAPEKAKAETIAAAE